MITLAGSYGIYYIHVGVSKVKAQTAQIKDARSRKLFEDAITDVANLAALSVNAMEQTTARALRDAVKTGTKNRNDLLAGETARQQIMLCPRENSITPAISSPSFAQIACRLPINLRTVARYSSNFSCVSRPGKFHLTCVTSLIHFSISSGTP